MTAHPANTPPSAYPKRILMAVTGKTPQVVTETLWALAIGSEVPFIPTEIRILTTEEGRRHAIQKLFGDGAGAFHTLCAEWGLHGIRFDETCIEVVKVQGGAALEDIITPEDNKLAADVITRWIRKATEDEDSAIHVSLAGGRKTMGYYVGYVISMFGRPQDRLSHVLIDSEFENKVDFYYPTRNSKFVFTQDQKSSADAARARVHLAMIPFIRMKTNPAVALKMLGDADFSTTVAAAEAALATRPSLVVDFESKTIVCGGQQVKLGPKTFAMYAWLALRRKKLGDSAGISRSEEGLDDNCREYLMVYARTLDWQIARLTQDRLAKLRNLNEIPRNRQLRLLEQDPYYKELDSLKAGLTEKKLWQAINHIKNALTKQLKFAADPYCIGSLGTFGDYSQSKRKWRSLTLPPDCIVIAEPRPPADFKLPLELPSRSVLSAGKF